MTRATSPEQQRSETDDTRTTDPHRARAQPAPDATTPSGQLRSLRGTAQPAPLAGLDSLIAYEVRLESRLTELLDGDLATAAR